jgi:hypothetical protein
VSITTIYAPESTEETQDLLSSAETYPITFAAKEEQH